MGTEPAGGTAAWVLLLGFLAAVPVSMLAFYLLRRLSDWLHRPWVRPGAATPPEFALPPALVCLLVQGPHRAPRTISATLLDLAARGYLRLDQDGSDPTATTIAVSDKPPSGPAVPELTLYEAGVLRRVRDSGQPTLAALAQWRATELPRWLRDLEDQVVEDALARGLLRGGDIRAGLGVVAVMTSCALGLALPFLCGEALRTVLVEDPAASRDTVTDAVIFWSALACFPFTWGALAAGFIALLGRREYRYHLTGYGRRASAYWRGVRRWLRRYESFADLPPAAVIVWGQYLGYGAALEVATTATAAIGLDGGDRPVAIGSHHGGGFRVVRVRYPRHRRFGAVPSGVRLAAASLALAGAAVAARWWRAGIEDALGRTPAPMVAALAGVAALVVGWLGYVTIRAAADLLVPARVTGTVLARIPLWGAGRYRQPLAPRCLLVVDDGRPGPGTAWRARKGAGERAVPGTSVRLRGQRWSRYVTSVTGWPADEPAPAVPVMSE